jgi:hypothetical protein
MPLGPDTSYSGASKIYTKQQPDGQTINGNAITTEQVCDVGSVVQQYGVTTLNGQVLPGPCSFTIAPFGAGGTHQVSITIQVQDNGGQPITGLPWDLDVILSDNANGVGVTATAPSVSTTVNAGGGTLLNTYIANKAFYVQTNASGQVQIIINDASKTGYYIMCQAGNQPFASVSRQLVSGDYS